MQFALYITYGTDIYINDSQNSKTQKTKKLKNWKTHVFQCLSWYLLILSAY